MCIRDRVRSPDYTTELMIRTLTLLREDYGFSGYIHAKAIPGADPLLTARLGRLADRLSVNIELPSSKSPVSYTHLPEGNGQKIERMYE